MKQHATTGFFRDKDGRLTLAQAPNAPMIGWLVLLVASWLLPEGSLRELVRFFSEAFAFVWAYLELVQGDSGFRRLLGALAIAGLLAWKIASLV